MLFGQQHIPIVGLNGFYKVIPIGSNVHDGWDFFCQTPPLVLDLGGHMGIEDRPVFFPKQHQKLLNVRQSPPGDIATTCGKLLDRFKIRHGSRPNRSVLNIDDEKSGPNPESRWTTKACGTVGADFFFADDVVPRFQSILQKIPSSPRHGWSTLIVHDPGVFINRWF